jgi:hypothetical protein
VTAHRFRSATRQAYAEYRAVAAAGAAPFPALAPMFGQWTLEPEELDCDPVLVWLPVELVVVVVLVCAKTPPIDEMAAMADIARIEYARTLLLLLLKPILKLIFSFHLPVTLRGAPVITELQERPQISSGFSPND